MNPQQIPYWTSTEASTWKEFLNSDTGKKILRFLAESEPPLLRKGDVNEILIRSGEAAHHREICAELLALTGADEVKDIEEDESFYPSLEDDSKWSGEKINPNT